MYRKEPKIHPREVSGRFDRLRKLAVVLLLGLYYFVPWLQWDGRQAVLFDLPERKFFIFGLTLWPQDFIYLALLLVIAGLTLFFFTALAGRLWCGFACPQTVWTEAFLLMERWAEGKRHQRIKLDKAPWGWQKFRRKAFKQAMWITFAAWTGFTFVGFFTPIREIWSNILSFSLGPWETFWMVFYSFATYGNAGFLREQVCKYMCPYARFQSAMFDHDTLVISYDPQRGDPRGGRRKGANRDELGLGDCIDCTLCVQVCPTGIDIRNGLQYECIACAACIDVCDQVMDKMAYPRGLIRYTTENALQGKPSRVLRPRVAVYATILLLLVTGVAWSLSNRIPLRAELIRDRNVLYRELPGDLIENRYTLKLINMDDSPHRFNITVSGNEFVRASVSRDLALAPEEVGTFALGLVAPRSAGQGVQRLDITFTAVDNPELSRTTKARLLLPGDPP
ncbi:MAG: cytochrome c oxidase accessory protein CcoG [Xanthomonadales bacterium]|nr:cytochrome c oxidase accessory protein CcoG [Xanthomonadales bacterium]